MAAHDAPEAAGFPAAGAALVIGHAGHELRACRWLEIVRPLAFVIIPGQREFTALSDDKLRFTPQSVPLSWNVTLRRNR